MAPELFEICSKLLFPNDLSLMVVLIDPAKLYQ